MKITAMLILFFSVLWISNQCFGTDSHTFDDSTIASFPKDSSAISRDSVEPAPLYQKTQDLTSAPPIDSAFSDSINRDQLRITLLDREKKRSTEHYHQNIDQILYDPFKINSSILFLSDGTTPSEALRSHPLVTSARYGISTSLNRFMLYGAVAPVNKIHTGNLLYSRNNSTIRGTDQVSVADVSDIHFNDFGTVRYHYNPGRIVSPEALIYWENGVFDEQLLLVNVSRPISRNLVVNAFTNYRYFKGGLFSHSADIRSFYGTIGDTASVADKGYNPLTDEFLAGAAFSWTGQNQSQLNLKITYGDLNHEISNNKPVQSREKLNHALYKRYPFELNTGTSWKINERIFLDFEGMFREEPTVRITGDSVDVNKTLPRRQDARDREFNLALRSGIEMRKKDSLGLYYNLNRTAYTLFDKSETVSNMHRPEIFYSRHFQLWDFKGLARAGAGLTYFSLDDTSETQPVWNAGASVQKDNQRYSIYFQLDNIPFIINYDSLWFDQVLLDTYYKAGAQATWKWNKAELLLGYQLVYGPDSTTVNKSWPSGIAPYQQPISSFVIAPSIGRWNGFALKSSINISDRRPFLKIHSALSFMAHPVNTQEYIDAALTFDYWSERDQISFAGFQDWNNPICNLGLEATVHIRSFRLFYKVDNILNRRFAYIPGYYSPGITFRWGFNWFLQR